MSIFGFAYCCFPLLHRLRIEDEGIVWEEVGIINEYLKWKITPEVYRYPKSKKDIYFKGVWQANFKNITDKRKRIAITFSLLDKDNFTIVSVSKGDYDADAIYLFPKEEKIIEGTFAITKKQASFIHRSQICLAANEAD